MSKSQVDGETNWASVGAVIEHDANVQPGNSGGPLVTADTGEVVAVNHRGRDPGTGSVQFLAISSDLARPTVGELQGGDIVERVEGLSVGADGTLEVYSDFVQVEDDTGTVAVEVPVSWSDVDGTSREGADGAPIPSIAASPDLASFYGTWDTPGVEVLAAASSPGGDLGELLDGLVSGAECVDAGREPYEDNLYAGLIQFYSDCGDTGAALVAIAAQPPDASFILAVIVQMTSEADLAVLDQVVQTFIVQV